MVKIRAITFGNKNALIFTLSFLLAFSLASYALAARSQPYTPGESLDPLDCAPGEANCFVSTIFPLTQGGVAFTNASGNLTQDNGNLFWDDTNNRFGILDTTPAAALTVGSGDLFQVTSAGLVFLQDGASGAGNLALSFVGDTNTGLYRSAADEMRIQTGGSDRVTFDASGRVGIGTASPGNLLDVRTNGATNTISSTAASALSGFYGAFQAQTARGTIASPTAIQSTDVIGRYNFGGYNGTSYVSAGYIQATAAGTFSGSANPTSIDIFGTRAGATTPVRYARFSDVGVANAAQMTLGATNGVTLFTDATSVYLGAGSANGSIYFYNASGGTNYLANINNNGFAVGSGSAGAPANVKLYSLSTTEQLRLAYNALNYWSHTVDVNGNMTLSNANAFGGGNGSYTIAPFAAAHFIVNLSGGGNAIFSGGNVGIGTSTTVSAKLQSLATTEQLRVGYDASNYYSTTVGSTGGVTFDAVGSGAGFTFSDSLTTNVNLSSGYAGTFFNDGNNANRSGILIQAGLDDHTAAGPSTLIAFSDGDGTAVGSITFGNSATAYNTTSDQRLKENIADSADGIVLLNQIKVRDYSFVADSSHAVYQGFIAQELYEIYPRAVTKPVDEQTAYWMVDYSKLTPLVVKAIQDLDIKFETLSSLDTSNNKSLGSLIKEFLGNASNTLANLYAKVIHADRIETTDIRTKDITSDRLCLEDLCITKSELQSILSSGANSGSQPNPPVVPEPTENNDEEEAGSSDEENMDVESGETDESDEETPEPTDENSDETEVIESPESDE